ncbi:C-GCAxxG-C-C family protein [Acidobacteriota bacterium]
MKNKEYSVPRRDFFLAAPALVLGSHLFSGPFPSKTQEKRVLPEELSPEEQKEVQSSVMAQDLLGFFGQGYSCAEAILRASLNRMKMNEDLVWAASGFGGGMYHTDLCGFLTGGFMAIGFLAGMLKMDRADAKKISEELVKKYWSWWRSQAPLHCSEIRSPETSAGVCRRIGQLASVRVEELILSYLSPRLPGFTA